MKKFKLNKNWNMFKEDGNLFITRGADEIYYLDEVKGEQVDLLYNAYVNDNFDALLNDSSVIEIIEKLEKAGVIYQKKFKSKDKIKIGLKYYGVPTNELKKSINDMLLKNKRIDLVDNFEDCNLLLIIRLNSPIKNILKDYEKIDMPHLLIDLSYSNNMSIGPLVFKNSTACLGCFIGRLTKNWGDLVPPDIPNISTKVDLICSIVNEKIEEFINCGNCPDLINNVWSFNINNLTSSYNKIYKLPWCPICGDKCDNEKLELSWIDEGLFNENK